MAGSSPDSRETIAERYVVESVLGAGGMGAVYRVLDARTGRHVALKRLQSKGRTELSSLFQREFYTLSQLAHPRIIEVYDYGVDDTGPYYTMELLDGSDLREHRRLPWREACTVLCDVASSLAILHSRRLLHRDVTPRNVRRTSDGRAKLLDFGAMAPMGVPKYVVGTPACLAPEAVQLQALDGRADLYSLGVVAYVVLTTQYPYPARTVGELAEVWKRDVRPPRELVTDVPAALSQLVMQLLSVNRSGRPASAAEVMDRLGAVAGIEPDHHEDVSVAYLTTPTLVGRDELVAEARGCLSRASEGRGSTLVVAGDAGSGRTQALAACVLEAKLTGAVTLRADASDGATGDYGVARALGQQLMHELPETAGRAAALHRPVLDKLRTDHDASAPAERRRLQSALRDWLIAVARSHRLFIAVDDVDEVDEPSAALLAALAHGAERRGIVVTVTRQRDSIASRPIQILEEHGRRFDLTPLSETQTEALVRSVFGDVEQVVATAHRIFEVSRGNPRDAMALIEHLVQTGRARHQAGAWTLPKELRDSDLPRSLTVALEMRLQALDADALELAQALSLTDAAWVALEDYTDLSEHGDASRVFRALSSLVAGGILILEGNRYRFAQRRWPSLIEARLSNDLERALHARLARIAERRQDPVRLLEHLMNSGQELRAIEELITRIGTDALEYSPRTLRLLTQAINAASRHDISQQSRLILELRAIGVSSLVSDYATFLEYAPRVVEQLKRDSGLLDLEELDEELALPDRLQQALMRAHARHQATAERDRGFPPFEAIKRLARLYAAFAAMSGTAQEPDLLARLPSLMPFAALSPAAAVIQRLIDGELALEQGRLERAREHFSGVLDLITEPDGAGLEPAYRDQIRYSLTFIVAAIDARCGLPSTLRYCDELEKVPRHRVNAWRARRAYYRLQGDIERTKHCQRQIELLEVQDGPQPFQNASHRVELLSCWLSDDLIGVKGFFDALDDLARRFPRLRVLRQLAHCHYHRIRGEHQRALAELGPALEIAEPARHIDWQYVATAHVELLTRLGRQEEALEHAADYLESCEREGLTRAWREIERPAVLALAAAGRAEEARERADRLIEREEADGVSGIMMTLCYATRARVAIALRDRPDFERWTALCAEHCERADNPALSMLYDRLLLEARRANIGAEISEGTGAKLATAATPFHETAACRLAECTDQQERARCALTLLLESASSKEGFLFGVRGGALDPLAAVPPGEPPAELCSELSQLLEAEVDAPGSTALVDPDEEASTTGPGSLTETGFFPVLLFARRDVDMVIAAVAAIAPPPEQKMAPPDLVRTIADALVDHADVDPVTCFL